MEYLVCYGHLFIIQWVWWEGFYFQWEVRSFILVTSATNLKKVFFDKTNLLIFLLSKSKKINFKSILVVFFFMNFQRSQNWLPPCLGEKGTMGQVASWHHPENQFNIIHIILWEAVKLQLRKELWYNYAWRVSSEAAVIQLP